MSSQCLVDWCTEDHGRLDDWDEDSANHRSRMHRRTWPSGINLLLLEPDDEHDGPRISLPPDDDNDVMHTPEQAIRLAAEPVQAAAMAQGHLPRR